MSDVELQARAGQSVLVGVGCDDLTEYVVNPGTEDAAPATRPTIADLSTVPEGTRVFVNDIDHGVCDDGKVEIESGIPGTYRVRLDPPFPWQPFEAEVVVA
ncbi:MAG: hypothetical protein WD928_04940 [Gammaproteobacteria bacterium]